jgi:ribonuclease HI
MIYKGAILPLLLYGAPVWVQARRYEYNRLKYIRVQRLMNLRIAKAFHTTSSEALCILAGTTPIIIKTEEAVKLYNIIKGKGYKKQIADREVELNNWPHPGDVVKITEVKDNKDNTIQIYTDGSKNEHGVGSGVVIFVRNELIAQLKFKLDKRCSNNQAEQLAIVKALEEVETDNGPCTVTIFTYSKIAIYSLKNIINHNYLIEEIRKKVSRLERANWKIEFSWVKAHVGTFGNELGDQLAKAAARNGHYHFLQQNLQENTDK